MRARDITYTQRVSLIMRKKQDRPLKGAADLFLQELGT